MIDETGKDIGITELEAEENRQNNSMSFDDIEFGDKNLNQKIEITKVEEETKEEPIEDEESDIDDDLDMEDVDFNFDEEEGEVEE